MAEIVRHVSLLPAAAARTIVDSRRTADPSGHCWRVCNEMAAAMLLPAAGALALLATGVFTDAHTLVMLEHTVMFPTMLVAMLLRRDEYAGHDHHATAPEVT